MLNIKDIPAIIKHTRKAFEANNIHQQLPDKMSFDEFKMAINAVWGWESDATYYMLDGFYRHQQRLINTTIYQHKSIDRNRPYTE